MIVFLKTPQQILQALIDRECLFDIWNDQVFGAFGSYYIYRGDDLQIKYAPIEQNLKGMPVRQDLLSPEGIAVMVCFEIGDVQIDLKEAKSLRDAGDTVFALAPSNRYLEVEVLTWDSVRLKTDYMSYSPSELKFFKYGKS